MDLKNIGFLFILIGISSVIIHFILELYSILKIKIWINKNKQVLLLNNEIKDKYVVEVVSSKEYLELKQIHDEAPFIFKNAATVGLNYLDFYFFQGLIYQFYSKDLSDTWIVHNENQETIKKLRKLLWILLSFNISQLFKKVGFFFTKFSIVYFIVVFLYEKLF